MLTLYHEQPAYGVGNPHNDYGLGFYCTESLELACEWGAAEEADEFASEYASPIRTRQGDGGQGGGG